MFLDSHIGIDSICILRERAGFESDGSAKKYQERRATPTATIQGIICRLSVCLAAVKKLMGCCSEYWKVMQDGNVR